MTTILLELPDDIYEAVQIEAEHFGTTAKERIERMVESTHRHRVNSPRSEMADKLDQLVESNTAKPLREYLPTSNLENGTFSTKGA